MYDGRALGAVVPPQQEEANPQPGSAHPGIPGVCAMHASTLIQKRMPNTAAARAL